eukprot:TRINITY_DN57237_c0_g1_i1.p2 TRINITY_DN57237_c0_g1~~TRINITY_DN57237_c0_g1_i1.p2  ORF type:complete len:395 (+),score=115.86 TRINITY_DN57237_c0_g1_i1:146-1330(+)
MLLARRAAAAAARGARPTRPGVLLRQGRAKADQTWIETRRKDKFYQKAVQEGFRSRASYKLQQVNARCRVITPDTRVVVDLGCAPGSWLQVAAQEMELSPAKKQLLLGVDLQPVIPIPGAITVTGDFTTEPVQRNMFEIIRQSADPRELIACSERDREFEMQLAASVVTPNATGDTEMYTQGPNSQACLELRELSRQMLRDEGARLPPPLVDVVVSDMAGEDRYGERQVDVNRQLRLVYFARGFAMKVLRKGGSFVCKIWQGSECSQQVFMGMSLYFERTELVRPPAVVRESKELFAVCTGFIGRERIVQGRWAGVSEALAALGDCNPHLASADFAALESPEARRARGWDGRRPTARTSVLDYIRRQRKPPKLTPAARAAVMQIGGTHNVPNTR